MLDMEFFKKTLFFDEGEDAQLFLASYNIYPNDEGLFSMKDMKQNMAEPEEALPIWLSNQIAGTGFRRKNRLVKKYFP